MTIYRSFSYICCSMYFYLKDIVGSFYFLFFSVFLFLWRVLWSIPSYYDYFSLFFIWKFHYCKHLLISRIVLIIYIFIQPFSHVKNATQGQFLAFFEFRVFLFPSPVAISYTCWHTIKIHHSINNFLLKCNVVERLMEGQSWKESQKLISKEGEREKKKK